jgi:two-component system phosphate regulon response regulator PhoB
MGHREEALRLRLRYDLENEGYEIEMTVRGDEAVLRLEGDTPDAVALCLTLAGLAGVSLCRRSPAGDSRFCFPISIVMAHRALGERKAGRRDQGHILKSFSVRDFLRRSQAAMQEMERDISPSALRAGDIVLNSRMHRVVRGRNEFRLLEFLMRSPGQVFSREQIVRAVWDDCTIDDRTIDVHIGRLRKALNRGRRRDPIRTVRGFGYAFKEEHYLQHDTFEEATVL